MALTNTLPIVGSHYGPQRGSPSKTLISVLAIGTPLFLMAEPENQFDPYAVAVYLSSSELTPAMQDALPEPLADFGFTLEQILAGDSWHLGYVPKGMARKVQPLIGSAPFPVTFSLSSGGAPHVRSEEPFEI